MKFIFILLLSFLINFSPLVFKVSKTVTTLEPVNLGTFDTNKYKQIRLVFKIKNAAEIGYSSVADLNFRSAQKNLESVKKYVEQGVYSRSQLQEAEKDFNEAQKVANYSKFPPISIYSSEDNEETLIQTIGSRKDGSLIIDTPPSKINIRVFGEGEYTLYVYGTQ